MLNRLAKILLGVTIVAVMGVGPVLAQAPAQPQWKDQQEYALYDSITKETVPAKRLELLNTWTSKYPESAFKKPRLVLLLSTYQALNQPAKMVDAAKDILAVDPNEVNALMWLAYFGPAVPSPPTADSLAAAEKAAQGLLNEPKPEGVKDDDWAKLKADFGALGHNTLGLIALQRKQLDAAEQEFGKALQASTTPPCQSKIPVCPMPGQISLSMANAIIAQKKPERYSAALYELARAASMTGPGALPPANQKQADAFLTKAYTTYHGADEAGLKELRTTASAGPPLPPDGFKILDKNEIDAAAQAKFAADNPSLALWKTIKDGLTAPNGEMYFESSVKGAGLPGGANGVTKFRAKLVSTKPALNPKELVLAISAPDTPEVTLKFETPLRGKADPGTEISFEGLASAFTKDPFMLTFDVEKDKVEGWPVQAAPPVKKRPTAVKKKQ